MKYGKNHKNATHGMRYTTTYASWQAMKDRCLNTKSKDYSRYGEKGITVCKEWLIFENFYADMGDKPTDYSIDRINNIKGYSKDNCRWANRNTQQRNKSTSLWIEWKGQVKHIMEVAKELGISKGAAHLRYKRGKLYV